MPTDPGDDTMSLYVRVPGAVHRWLRGRVVVIGPDGRATNVDGTAAVVWEVAGRPRSSAELVAAADDLAPDDLPPETLRAWVSEATATLLRTGLLIEVDPAD